MSKPQIEKSPGSGNGAPIPPVSTYYARPPSLGAEAERDRRERDSTRVSLVLLFSSKATTERGDPSGRQIHTPPGLGWDLESGVDSTGPPGVSGASLAE